MYYLIMYTGINKMVYPYFHLVYPLITQELKPKKNVRKVNFRQ